MEYSYISSFLCSYICIGSRLDVTDWFFSKYGSHFHASLEAWSFLVRWWSLFGARHVCPSVVVRELCSEMQLWVLETVLSLKSCIVRQDQSRVYPRAAFATLMKQHPPGYSSLCLGSNKGLDLFLLPAWLVGTVVRTTCLLFRALWRL